MLARSTAVALSLVVIATASAAPSVMVCKWSGKVMPRCACPARTDRTNRLAKSSCCELRSAPKPGLAVVPPTPAPPIVASMAALAMVTAQTPACDLRIAESSGPAPPYSKFLLFRQLLI